MTTAISRRFGVRCSRTAILTAFGLAAILASSVRAATTYTWGTFTPGTTASWSDGTMWTPSGDPANAANYPGGDAAILADIATISPTASIGGAYTINFTGMTAASIGSMTLTMPSTSLATDTMAFNISSGTLATTGNAIITSGSSSIGKTTVTIAGTLSVGSALTTNAGTTWNVNNGGILSVTGNFTGGNGSSTALTIASGASATIGGIISYGSGNSVWTINVNGSLTTGGISTNTSVDAANININGTASLGNIVLGRSSGTSTSATAAGIHVQSGTATANNIQIGTSNSAGLLEVPGGQLTINGATFAVGQANSNRRSTVFVDGGTLIATNAAGLVLGQTNVPNTASAIGAGGLIVSSGTATLEKLTLAGALATTSATPGTNTGTLTMTGGALYMGSGGIIGTIATGVPSASMSSNYSATLSGGTLGAKAPWSSAINMSLASGTPITFKSADAANNPFDIALSGNLTGAGGFTKAGGGMLTIGGTNSYAGATAITSGTLMLNSNLSGTGVNVGAGATLAGTGTITPALVLDGILSPGNGPGTINESGLFTFDAGSKLAFDLGPTASPLDTDLVHFSAAADNLAGAGLATLALQGTIDYTKTYTIFDNTTTAGFAFAGITGFDGAHFGATFASTGTSYTLSFAPTTGVPEPTSLLLLGLGAASLLTRRRR